MEDLTHVELSDLYDLLAQQTNRYMRMLSEGATKHEFDQCREIIIAIQAEIQWRKNQKPEARDTKSNNSPAPVYKNSSKN